MQNFAFISPKHNCDSWAEEISSVLRVLSFMSSETWHSLGFEFSLDVSKELTAFSQRGEGSSNKTSPPVRNECLCFFYLFMLYTSRQCWIKRRNVWNFWLNSTGRWSKDGMIGWCGVLNKFYSVLILIYRGRKAILNVRLVNCSCRQ
jgi:hypothetical protein